MALQQSVAMESSNRWESISFLVTAVHLWLDSFTFITRRADRSTHRSGVL